METLVIERRRHPRKPAARTSWRDLRLRTGDALTLIDISPIGVLVESQRQLRPGGRVLLHFASDVDELMIEARVVRCSVCALEQGGGVRYSGALEFLEEGTKAAGTHLS